MKSQIMLNQTITVEKLIDFALLQLWYADSWGKIEKIPEDIKAKQEYEFRQQAQGIVRFLYQTLGLSSKLIDYKGIKIPIDWVVFFQERESRFEHPTTL